MIKIEDCDKRGFIFRTPVGDYLSFLDVFSENMAIFLEEPHMITIDFMAKAILDSACNLDMAFNSMMQSNNLFGAIPFIRMQLDNAMVAFGLLITKNDLAYFNAFAEGKPINQQKVDVGLAASYGIETTKDQQLTNRFLYESLDKISEGASDLYKRSCNYVHPSCAILKGSWFAAQKGVIEVKPWDKVQPYGYSKDNIAADYLKACIVLVKVIEFYQKLKLYNREIMSNMKCSDHPISGDEISKDFEKMIEILDHSEEKTSEAITRL